MYEKGAFKYGFIAGFVFSAGLLYWVLAVEVPMRTWLWLGVLLLFIYYGFVFGFSILFSRRVKSFIIPPLVWTGIEFLRSLTPEIGFPWGSIGYALVTGKMPMLPFIQFARFIGLPGITFFILLINSLLFYALWRKKLSYLIGAVAIICVVYVEGKITLRSGKWPRSESRFIGTSEEVAPFRRNPKRDSFGRSRKYIKVGVVQPNIFPEIKRYGEIDFRLSTLYTLSKEAGKCDLLIWPETAIPGYLGGAHSGLNELAEVNTPLQSKVCKIVDSLNIPAIMGATRIGGRKIYNSCFLVVPREGIKEFYDKIYLVPFAERLPFDELFPGLRRPNFGQGDFSKGSEYTVFELPARQTAGGPTRHSDYIGTGTAGKPGFKFSCLICFESIFPRISRRFVRGGAEFLVNITEDCWFGRTAGPYQHANQAILRAIEYGTTVVRCGNTGISYFVNPRGETRDVTEIFTQKVIVSKIPLRKRLTFYARYGDWFAWICVGFLFWLLNLRFIFRGKLSKKCKNREKGKE